MLTNPGPIQGFAVDQDGDDLPAYRRLTLTSGKLALAGATTPEIGTAAVLIKATAGLGRVAIGDVVMPTLGALTKMIAGGAISLTNGFAKVYAAANGKVASSGTLFIGLIFVAAGADGDEVDVMRMSEEFADSYALLSTTRGKKVVGGQLTTASAAETVVTGLTTVTSVVASFETDPADANELVSAQIGDQAGSPAAGSIIIKTWKTDGTDPTPVAATSFSKKVNWIAFGT